MELVNEPERQRAIGTRARKCSELWVAERGMSGDVWK